VAPRDSRTAWLAAPEVVALRQAASKLLVVKVFLVKVMLVEAMAILGEARFLLVVVVVLVRLVVMRRRTIRQAMVGMARHQQSVAL
jgi:hypothetical protein